VSQKRRLKPSPILTDRWRDCRQTVGRAEKLAKEVDLSKHGDFAADPQQNQAAIRQVFRKAPG